jgi:hypothetical protein
MPVDRLGALGIISRLVPDEDPVTHEQIARASHEERMGVLCSLGVRLMSFKYANCATSKADAEDMLWAVLAWKKLKLSPRQLRRVAVQAVMENAIDICPLCKSAKEIPDHDAPELEGRQPMKCCPPSPIGCGGTGKRRYTDEERAEAMGDTFPRAMSEAHDMLATAEALAVDLGKRILRG